MLPWHYFCNLSFFLLTSIPLLVPQSKFSAQAQITQYTASPLPTYTWRYNASTTINGTIDIARNGTGTAYAFACQSASASYINAYNNFLTTRTAVTLPTYVSSFAVTQELWDVWTTDCQGIPHVRGTAPTATRTIWNTTTYTDFAPGLASSYTGPSPTCFIQPSDCGAVQSSYSKESRALAAFTATLSPPFFVTSRPILPVCSIVCTASEICMIRGDEVRLIYWPVTTTGADSCRLHGTTVTPASASTTQSIVSLNTTFYSPSAYISFKSLWAWDWGCYRTLGTPISNTILALDPESLSSARGNHLGRSAVSFNLADLNGFVTSAAFCAQQPYDWYPCTTISDDLYNPIIWMPQEVLSFRPEWKNCGSSIFGIVDPPLALHTVDLLTSVDSKPTATPDAYPAPGASDKVASATPTAEGEHEHTTKPEQYGGRPQSTRTQSLQPAASSHTDGGDHQPIAASSRRHGGSDPEDPAVSQGTSIGGYVASGLGLSSAARGQKSHTADGYTTSGGVNPGPTSGTDHGSNPATAEVVNQASIASNGIVFAHRTTTISFTSFVADRTSYPSAWYRVETNSKGRSYALVAGATLYVAGHATTIDGHTVSAGTQGVVIDDSQTIDFGVASADAGTSGPAETAISGTAAGDATSDDVATQTDSTVVAAIGRSSVTLTYAPSSAGLLLPGGTTLAPGSVAVVNGETVSLAPSETALIVGGSTIAIAPPSSTGALTDSANAGHATWRDCNVCMVGALYCILLAVLMAT